jgi:hypothetical protein
VVLLILPPGDPPLASGPCHQRHDPQQLGAANGTEPTATEIRTLKKGCIGLVELRLGLLDGSTPPDNMVIGDAATHWQVAEAEAVLAPGEVATGRAMIWQENLVTAKKELDAALNNPDPDEGFLAVREAANEVKRIESGLEHALAKARETRDELPEEFIKEMRDARHAAKVAGGIAAFKTVMKYGKKFDDILARKPADKDEFLEMVTADKDLRLLKGVADHLPEGNPADWLRVTYGKQWYSGQEQQEAWFANPFSSVDHAPDTPDPAAFAPDPVTGQIDMSKDRFLPKPGYIKYDYSVYDPVSGNWLHANHDDDDPANPMYVYQSTLERLSAGYVDFDTMGFGIVFVNKNSVHWPS